MGRHDDARRIMDRIRDEWQGRLDSTLLLCGRASLEGTIALGSGQFQRALDQFYVVRKKMDDSTSSRVEIAEAYIGLEKYDGALAELRQLRKEAELTWPSANYLRGLYLEGDALVKLGRNKDAVEPLSRLMVFWGEADWEVSWLNDAKRLYSSLTAQ